jgi:PAS domain S-box-containing protein
MKVDLPLLIHLLNFLLLSVAASLALRLPRVSGSGWVRRLLTSAFLLMAVSPLLDLYGHFVDQGVCILEISDLIVTLSSALMLAGIILLPRIAFQRQKEQASLRESRQYHRILMERSRDGIVIVNQAYQVVEANARFAEMLGYTPDELIGMHPWEFEANMTEADIRRIFPDLSEISTIFESRQRRKDGSVFDVEVSLGGTMIGDEAMVLSVCRDITARKQQEAAMARANRALRTISAGNQALVHADDEAHLLQEMCEVVVKVGGYPVAWIGYSCDDAARSVQKQAQAGTEEDLPGQTWDVTHGSGSLAGKAIVHRQTYVVQDIEGSPDPSLWREHARQHGHASCIAMPLMDGDNAFGALVLFDDKVNAFDADEVKLLEELAGDLAFGILTLRIKLAHREHEQRLQQNMLQTVETIASIIEIRDPYTSGHQRRVAKLACAIASRMGLSQGEIQGIHLAGVVHDMGKISIPSEILSKPGRLNEIEYSLIKMHPQAGYEILKEIDFPWPIAQIVRQHHERMDGSGYPQGLKGDEILLEARILAVADVLEAMASHRPYRPGLGIKVALKTLAEGRGTQFDPQVVDACIALLREDSYGLPQ